jgi:chromosome segregation ATPase
MSKDVKVTLGPSLAEKQKTIDKLTLENVELTTQLEKLKASYAEME